MSRSFRARRKISWTKKQGRAAVLASSYRLPTTSSSSLRNSWEQRRPRQVVTSLRSPLDGLLCSHEIVQLIFRRALINGRVRPAFAPASAGPTARRGRTASVAANRSEAGQSRTVSPRVAGRSQDARRHGSNGRAVRKPLGRLSSDGPASGPAGRWPAGWSGQSWPCRPVTASTMSGGRGSSRPKTRLDHWYCSRGDDRAPRARPRRQFARRLPHTGPSTNRA